LPFGSGVVVIVSAQAHLTRVGTLSGPGSRLYPVSYPGRSAEGRSSCPGFLLPFGHRHSLLGSSHPRRGIPPSSRSAYRTNHPVRTPSGLPRSTRSRCDRGGCPLYPGDGGALPAKRPPSPAPAASQRPVPTLRWNIPSAEPTITRHQSGVHVLHPSGLLLACDPRMERGSSGFPRGSAPRRYQRRTPEWRQALSTDPELRSRQHQSVLQSACSLIWVRLCCSDYAAARGMTLLA
jgi:hypothetical protein